MGKKLTRRQFGKLAVAGAGAAAAAAAGVGLKPDTAEAFAPGFIDRWRGPVYTSGGLDSLQDCMNRGSYNMKKVVTAWPYNPWPQSEMTRVCINIQGTTLVRSYRGDGSADGKPPDWAYPIGDSIVNEIRPWYNTQNWIWIELGNEPNGYVGWVQWAVNTFGWARDPDGIPKQLKPATYDSRADQFIWNWRYWLNDAIAKCKANFQTRPVGQPRATIVSPALSSAINPGRWFAIAYDVMSQCDYIGFHALQPFGFYDNPSDLVNIVPLLNQYFPNKNLLLTEYGINSTSITKGNKGRKYAEFLHFNKSNPILPARTIGGVYYHRSVDRETNYNIYSEGDDAYKYRITVG